MRTTLIFVVSCLSLLFAQKETVQEQFFSTPRSSAKGVVFSDHLAGGIFFHSVSGSVTQISDRPGSGTYFTISSDGSLVGFKEIDEQGKQQPVVYNVISNEKEILHSGSSLVGQVSFSDNGVLAFTVEQELCVLNNSGIQKFNLGTYSNLAPISPDGNRAAFNDHADQIRIIDLRDGTTSKISDGIASYFLPQWSPDGSRILYSSLSGNLFVYSVSSKQNIFLCEGFSPSWMDNETILFQQKETDKGQLVSSDIFSMNIGERKRRQLTFTDDCFEVDPSFDAQTQTIYYSDVKRQGIYTRQFLTREKRAAEENKILSFEKIPAAQKQIVNSETIDRIQKPAAVYFEMPYAHQVYDTPDWYNGHSACGATSSIMVIAYYNIVPKWNVWCSASGSSPGHYSPYGNYVCELYAFKERSYSASATDPNGKLSYGGYGFMWTGSYSPYSRTVDYYTNHGMSASRFDSPSHESIIAEADSGRPYTVCNGLTTSGHIVVVNGYDATSNRTLIVNDPYGNKNSGSYPSLNGKGIKYDWPGYNNGYKNLNTIYWGVSVKYTISAAIDTLVDDSQSDKGFMLYSAIPSILVPWSVLSNGYAGHFWWTRTKKSDTCFATWTGNLEKDGQYEVFAYVPMSEATDAKYKVYTKDGMQTVVVNQKNIKNDWLSLGTFSFLKGSSAYVRLGDGSDSTKQAIVFDAVKWSYRGTGPASVTDKRSMPNAFVVEQNYPNPFNPATVISYQLPKTNHVSLKVYDIMGKEITTLVNEQQEAGRHQIHFAADGLASGFYFYRITAGAFSETKKMSLQK